jgi:Clip-domain serine protease homolog masquerade
MKVLMTKKIVIFTLEKNFHFFTLKVHTEPYKSKTNPPKYTKPQSTKKPFQQPSKHASTGGQGQVLKECEGECVSGLFALFCDDIDTDAFCPNEGSCCMPAGSVSDKEISTTSPRTTTPVCRNMYILL